MCLIVRDDDALPATTVWPSRRQAKPCWRCAGENAAAERRGWKLELVRTEGEGVVFQVGVGG